MAVTLLILLQFLLLLELHYILRETYKKMGRD